MRLILLTLFLSIISYSQDKYLNSVYSEILGSGGLYSFNYERMISDRNSIRVGISYVDLSHSWLDVKYVSAPLMYSQYFFSQRNQLELSGGVVLVAKYSINSTSDDDSFYRDVNGINGVTYIGYRDWNEESKIVFRFGCAQLFNNHSIGITGGLSVGYIF